MQAITLEGFDGIAIDQLLEQRFGILHAHDWKYRKALQVAEDCRLHPQGVFVAELRGSVVGYISTRIDREIGKGRIPNLAVDKRAQGQGIGRKLIEHALAYFRREGLSFAMIETMAINPVG
ncbi:MAG: GNAT family N-acetyltransferase, partial [Pirellulaceae bacterium]